MAVTRDDDDYNTKACFISIIPIKQTSVKRYHVITSSIINTSLRFLPCQAFPMANQDHCGQNAHTLRSACRLVF